MILYNHTGRTYIFAQILSSVQPWREQSLGFLLQLKEVQHVQHGLFDVGAKTVGVLEQRKMGLKISATTTAKKGEKKFCISRENLQFLDWSACWRCEN